ncbi:AraC family transcriptional regulator [Cystobacter fuscus]|uniref:AraC family transcriptional regulator n=1 Tax=Cystobacter fuscus TaxID=43 RepID=A0A250J4V1_9BACT|nr:helix-turn-helix domain-containing protein [Cystobacter fuscus]ATB38570.1 AraC family transcriptional regulator [Cystobacter fuscus]
MTGPGPGYIERPPCAALAPFVQCYWALTGYVASPRGHRVLPDGCIDVLVELGSSRKIIRVVGAMQRAEVVPLLGEVCSLGIRFLPGGAHPFLRFGLDVLTDGDLALDALWPREAREWVERLEETRGVQARLALLDTLLLERHVPAVRDEALAHAVGLIHAARGQIRIQSLEERLGVGARQLERRFRATVGLSPKVLCRIARMQHATELLERWPDVGGAELALAAGYYDQAHLGKEFRALTGLAPGAYARERAGVGFVQATPVPGA